MLNNLDQMIQICVFIDTARLGAFFVKFGELVKNNLENF